MLGTQLQEQALLTAQLVEIKFENVVAVAAVLESLLKTTSGDALVELSDVGIEHHATLGHRRPVPKPVTRQLGAGPKIAAARA
jgi:hypothetical protein